MSRILTVVPALNESAVLPAFIDAWFGLRHQLAGQHDLHLLVVDDGSTDTTLRVLRDVARRHPMIVSYLSLASNSGHQSALIAGMCHAGTWPDAIITMDSDLEHPMEVVPQLIDEWQRTGAIIVHAIRRESKSLSWKKRWPSALFYRVTSRLTGLSMTPGQADFRLWDAATVRGVREYLPHIGSLRVFAAWLGQHASVEYDQRVQHGRDTRFTFRRNYELAAISIIRFSHFPLRAITVIGAFGLGFSAIYALVIAIAVLQRRTVPGWSSLILSVLIMGCLQLLAIGILASYLRRLVFARDLPPFIVREASDGVSSHLAPVGSEAERLQ
jgi:dolichol-phosphate mannosyltransferase